MPLYFENSFGANYKGELFTLPDGFIKTAPDDFETRFSIGEIYRDKTTNGKDPLPAGPTLSGVTELFRSLVNALSFFPDTKKEVGIFAETALDADTLDNIYPTRAPEADVVPPTVDNLLTTGFEAIEFVLVPDPQAKLQTLTPALVKVRHPANVVLWNFHGNHDGKIFPRSDRDYAKNFSTIDAEWELDPATEVGSKIQEVDCLLMVSCSTLDVNDYNNHASRPDAAGVWPTAAERNFGGEKWDAVRRAKGPGGEPGTVLLGYNHFGPYKKPKDESVSYSKEILANYQTELARISAMGGDAAQHAQAWAWMSANVKFADTSTDLQDAKWLALHASAIDDDYYYYVPFEYAATKVKIDLRSSPSIPVDPYNMMEFDLPRSDTVNPSTPVYRVPRSKWGVDPPKWDLVTILGEKIAVALPITGLSYTP